MLTIALLCSILMYESLGGGEVFRKSLTWIIQPICWQYRQKHTIKNTQQSVHGSPAFRLLCLLPSFCMIIFVSQFLPNDHGLMKFPSIRTYRSDLQIRDTVACPIEFWIDSAALNLICVFQFRLSPASASFVSVSFIHSLFFNISKFRLFLNHWTITTN